MTLNQLQYFCLLAQIRHYTKTAEMLRISQPSLSYTISELEKELNYPLFEKNGKKVTLTPYGEIFYKYVDQALNLLDMGKNAVKKCQNSQKRCVNIGYIHSISASLIHPAINRFCEDTASEQISFNHVISNSNIQLLKLLIDEEIDLGFCLGLSNVHSGVPVFKQDLYILVSKLHKLSGKSEIEFEDIENEGMVVQNPGESLRRPIEAIFRRFGSTPKIVFEAGDFSSAIAYVLMGNNFMVSPILPSVDYSKFSILRLKGIHLWRPIYIAWKKDGTLSESAERFRDAVCKNCRLDSDMDEY